MNENELAYAFLEFEEDTVFSKGINCDLWMYIRHDVYELLCVKYGFRQNQDRCRYRYYKQRSLTPAQIKSKETIGNIKNLHHKDVLVIPHARRFSCGNGFYKCLYTDLLIQRLKKKCYVLDMGDVFQGFLPMDIKGIIYFDIADFRNVMNIPSPTSEDRIDEGWIDNIFLKEFPLKFDITLNVRELHEIKSLAGSAKYTNRIYKLMYSYLLNKVRPKVIVMVCYYSVEMMTLCETSKEYGIPTVELEHGLINGLHIDYNFLRKRNIKEFPDYIFTWGEKLDVRIPIEDERLRKVGFPELESRVKETRCKNKNILFISSINRDVAEYARYVSEKLDKDKYSVIFKLHPLEYGRYESDYGDIFGTSTVKVIKDTGRSVHDFLSISDWVIGTSSSSLFEATMFPTRIAVLATNEFEYCRELYENNYAILVESKDELLKLIESDSIELKKDDYFFKKDSLKRMESELNQIMERKS